MKNSPYSNMKQILLICAVVMGQTVLAADKKPLTKEESAKVIEAAIRKAAKKPTGELTKADLAKVTLLSLDDGPKITDAGLKEVAKLQQLKVLNLGDTEITDAGLKDLAKFKQLEGLVLDGTKITKADVAKLKKALPKCRISSNPTK
jgi:hypothetical protein